MVEEVLEQPEEMVTKEGEMKGLMVFLTPEGIIFGLLAVALDLFGIVCFILDVFFAIGEIPSWISDGIGIFIFGLWLLFRAFLIPGTTTPTELVKKVMEKRRATKEAVGEARKMVAEEPAKGAARGAEEAAKGAAKGARKMGRGLRTVITFAGEVAPFIGVLPFWTWFVYEELQPK